MVERGFIRVLTVPSRTGYFVDGARKRGLVAESATALEDMVAKQIGQPDAVRVVVVPVRRDQLIPMLRRGLGDVAIGNLTVTAEREASVDFATPTVSNVRELVVTGAGVAPVNAVEELAGREIWVRRSSSYFASLQAVSEQLRVAGREPVRLRVADERLEDEDLLEMVNAGLYPATVVDSHKLDWIWARVFDGVTVSDVAVRERGEIAAAHRKGSPQLGELLSAFFEQHKVSGATPGTRHGSSTPARRASVASSMRWWTCFASTRISTASTT